MFLPIKARFLKICLKRNSTANYTFGNKFIYNFLYCAYPDRSGMTQLTLGAFKIYVVFISIFFNRIYSRRGDYGRYRLKHGFIITFNDFRSIKLI